MKNDYIFWKDYLNKTIQNIEGLLKEKDSIYTDFHIHSDYSADGKQTLEDIINRSQKLGLDIIAITDHDSLKVYDDLYDYLVKNNLETPIIVPGVEFTVENNDYGSHCHILQLMVNPKEKSIMENVEYNEEAAWNRASIQFKRISENETLQYFFKKYNINCSKENYKEFLNACKRPIPEYSTLFEYLMKILSEHNITTWDIFNKLEENNEKDECKERRTMKENRYKVLKERYSENKEANKSLRFLHSMLAVRGVDDDYFTGYESSGSLSVNNYNQLKLENLNKNHITIFAHPSENKLNLMNKFQILNNNICGMEFNKQSMYSNSKLFYNKANELNMIKIIGSDSHTLDSVWYEDINFYMADKKELKKFIDKAREYV